MSSAQTYIPMEGCLRGEERAHTAQKGQGRDADKTADIAAFNGRHHPDRCFEGGITNQLGKDGRPWPIGTNGREAGSRRSGRSFPPTQPPLNVPAAELPADGVERLREATVPRVRLRHVGGGE